jgi:hypothetical protein
MTKITDEKLIKLNFLVVSDYKWLPENLEDSWVHKLTDNYLIYDKFGRPEWEGEAKVSKQKNLGQNIYDMFHFILTNYDNLPDVTIFCRAAILHPKDTGTPRLDKDGNRLSNGNCSEEKFIEVMNNEVVTELHDYGPEVHNGHGSRLGPDGSFLELNSSWFFNHVPYKYYTNTNTFLSDMYKNPPQPQYIRFAPGGGYIIPKANMLKYSKKFYERIIEILSWDSVIAEAHMLERCIYTIFTCDWEVRDEYK